MFFRPTRAGGDKRKRKAGGGGGQGSARKPGGKTGKDQGSPRRRARRLDSAVPLLRPALSGRRAAGLGRGAERGAPLSDATQWLLERMRRLKNLNDYAALKQPFIERYMRDPRHSPGSAERAFYQAVGVCIRRILEERAQRR